MNELVINDTVNQPIKFFLIKINKILLLFNFCIHVFARICIGVVSAGETTPNFISLCHVLHSPLFPAGRWRWWGGRRSSYWQKEEILFQGMLVLANLAFTLKGKYFYLGIKRNDMRLFLDGALVHVATKLGCNVWFIWSFVPESFANVGLWAHRISYTFSPCF